MNSKLIIGSILNNPKCLGQIIEHVKPAMLDDKQARDILQAVILMDVAQEPIELVTIAQRIKGIASYLTECFDLVGTSQNAEFYAKQQYEYWAKKKLAQIHSSMTFDGTLAECLTKLSNIVTDFERDFTDKPKVSSDAEQIASDYLRYVENIKTNKIKILNCNMPGLVDKINHANSVVPFYIGGLYIVVSSYSSAGKSAFLSNIAAREAYAGANVVIFSNEMGRFGYAERFVGYLSNIPYGHILENSLKGHQIDEINNALMGFSQLPIKIYDKVRGTAEIKSILKKLSYQQKIDIVMVDYLQNLVDKASDVKAQLDTASKSLMQLAQDMDLTIIAASQIDNASAKGQNTNVNFMSPKGSGDIAADADIFIELTRDALNANEMVKRKINLAVKKNRVFGRVGQKDIYFNKSFTRIESEYYGT